MFDAIGSFFTAIVYQPLFNLLFGFVALLPGESLGLGIIALTIFVKLLLVPSSAAAVRSQRELSLLQPKVDALRREYKDKPEELNQKMLALYQEHNVNPFGSCLPLLIQLPILIVLYRVFMNGLHPESFSLLYGFVPAPAALDTWLLGINLAAPSMLLGAIAAALQFIQTRQVTARQPARQPSADDDTATAAIQDASQRMLYIMPVMTFLISATLPAALPLYWLTTTIFSIGQQWWILRTNPAVATPHVAVTVSEPHRTVTVPDADPIAPPAAPKQAASRKKPTRKRRRSTKR